MQGKLVIQKSDLDKYKVAAHFRGVEITEVQTIGDEAHLGLKFKDISAIAGMAIMTTKVTGAEWSKIEASLKAKETAKK